MGDTEEDAGVEVSPPELRFLQKWHEKNPSLPHMRTVNRENVVFHAHLRQRPMATWSRLMFGSDTVPRNDNHVFSVKQLKVFSSADLTSQFVNDGYKCLGQAGKFMVFLRRRTMIRAGKYSTPQALNACFRVLRAFNSRYPTGFMAPNQVFSGEFQRPISDKLRYASGQHSAAGIYFVWSGEGGFGLTGPEKRGEWPVCRLFWV